MSKLETLSRIKEIGIVAVVRAKDAKEAIEFSKGCIDGGVSKCYRDNIYNTKCIRSV